MIFKHKTSKSAIFTVEGKRRQCVDGKYTTEDKREIQFLQQNKNFEEYDPSKDITPAPEDLEVLKAENEKLRAEIVTISEKLGTVTDDAMRIADENSALQKENEDLKLSVETLIEKGKDPTTTEEAQDGTSE